jgi:hypothetical protein
MDFWGDNGPDCMAWAVFTLRKHLYTHLHLSVADVIDRSYAFCTGKILTFIHSALSRLSGTQKRYRSIEYCMVGIDDGTCVQLISHNVTHGQRRAQRDCTCNSGEHKQGCTQR